MTRVLIIGAGGHAQVVADILLRARDTGQGIEPVGYLDDDPTLHGRVLLGLKVLGSINGVQGFPHDAVIVATGNNRTRKRLSEALAAAGERFFMARHPSAVVAPDVVIGPGAMICANVVVNPGSLVGAHAILNTGCTVDHHNRVGDYAHIAPGAHTGGEVVIGEGALVGIGATVAPRLSVGSWAVVGAGAVVTKSVPPGVTVVGVPARPLSKG